MVAIITAGTTAAGKAPGGIDAAMLGAEAMVGAEAWAGMVGAGASVGGAASMSGITAASIVAAAITAASIAAAAITVAARIAAAPMSAITAARFIGAPDMPEVGLTEAAGMPEVELTAAAAMREVELTAAALGAADGEPITRDHEKAASAALFFVSRSAIDVHGTRTLPRPLVESSG